jgi:hypothetical protein
LDSSSFPQKHQREGWERQGRDAGGGPAGSQDTSSLCPRCRRLTTQQHDLDLLESSEDSDRNPELALVTQAAAAELTKALNTLSSGISSERRGIIRVSKSWIMQPTPYYNSSRVRSPTADHK